MMPPRERPPMERRGSRLNPRAFVVGAGARVVEVSRTRFEAYYECRTAERVWQLAVVRLKRVLLADPHPGVRRLLVLTLAESIPCEILEAADGAAALILAREASPALLVL